MIEIRRDLWEYSFRSFQDILGKLFSSIVRNRDRLIISDMLGNKQFLFSMRNLYILLFDLCVIHPSLKLIVNRSICWYSFLIKFLVVLAADSQVMKFGLKKRPFLLQDFFFLLIYPFSPSIHQVLVKPILVVLLRFKL